MSEKDGRKVFQVHVGKVKLTYDHSPVSAITILEDANFKPGSEYTLETQHGQQKKEYNDNDPVDLTHETQFRAIPRGGGRA